MYKNLLPLGSVVLLEGGQRRVMIQGRGQFNPDSDVIYDYVGIPWPEGLPNTDSYIFFQKTAIERVYFLGYQDQEEEEFRENVLGAMEGISIENGQLRFPEGMQAEQEPVLLEETPAAGESAAPAGVDILGDLELSENSDDPALAEALDKAATEALAELGDDAAGSGKAEESLEL